MARVLPDRIAGATSKSVHQTFRALKRLPEKYLVWHRLGIHRTPGPDFMVLDPAGRALLVKVSPATPAEAAAARQPSLFDRLRARDTAPLILGSAEQAALQAFQDALTHWPESIPAAHGIIFPNLTRSELSLARRVREIASASQEDLEPDALTHWVSAHASDALPVDQLDELRAAFAPETIVPRDLTTRQPLVRNTEARFTDFLLDYDQEWALKLDLDLDAGVEHHARAFGLRLVNGVAGSGKSLLILYRARLLHELFPNKKILVLTHNRALIQDLEVRHHRLTQNGRDVEWRTIHSWCGSRLATVNFNKRTIHPDKRERLIREVTEHYFADTTVTPAKVQDELDWYKDQPLFGRDAYLEADRTGRGFGLQQSMRERMFDAFEAYEQKLGDHWIDWADIPRTTFRMMESGKIDPPRYDVVLIDEAQFFAPIWFEIVKRVLRPSGHLFIVADPTQGFLKRRQTWLASGLEVRGRSVQLTRSYRTTRDILDFAARFYQLRLPEDDDDIVRPEGLHQMPRGPQPQLIQFTSEQDELTRTVNELREFIRAGRPRKHILLTHPDHRYIKNIIDRLNHALGAGTAADPRYARHATDDYVRVCTLDAITGLEAPIVFVLGLHRLFEAEKGLFLAEDERAELLRDNTRRLYMAITRAGQRVILCYVGRPPDVLLKVTPPIDL